MYPVLPVGPFSLPTGPISALLAVWIGLETAARYSRKQGLHPDDIWNIGLLALLAGLIVARLWKAVQFWPVYTAEPLLIFSLRPSGFALVPGAIAAIVVGYSILLYKALDPLPVAAAFSVGLLSAGAVINFGAFLSGSVLGTPMSIGLPWIFTHFGASLHPVGLYRMVGLLLVTGALWRWGDVRRPGRIVLLALLGFSLVYLSANAFIADPALVGNLRSSQIVALAAAIASALMLARTEPKTGGAEGET
jgi:phosphatidylglycerol:prolipoprotein diacylglycerol transferase